MTSTTSSMFVLLSSLGLLVLACTMITATAAYSGFSAVQHPDQERVKRQLSQEGKKNKNDDSASSSVDFKCPTEQIGLPLGGGGGGDVNFLVVTDIHGWIAGQHARHEPEMDVDFGHLVSLYERLIECTSSTKVDWFLLFNGDFMDGTGLSTVPPQYLAPLIQEVPFAAINVGNHELYFNEVVDYMMEKDGFIDHWQGNYLASNVDYYTTSTNKREEETNLVPFGNRYTLLKGSNTNTTLLTFGFLYNFEGNCSHSKVQSVEETLKEQWFLHALTTLRYDAIVVLAHMDAVDPLIYTIHGAIRQQVGDTVPLHFFAGHTHRRHYEVIDSQTVSLEAGRFMDTIGFASINLNNLANKNSGDDPAASAVASAFEYRFLETNLHELTTNVLKQETGTDFSTPHGRKLSRKLRETQERLGLLRVVTQCSPQDYILAKPADDPDSLWWLYLNQVIPTTLLAKLEQRSSSSPSNKPIFIQGTGALRYSLLGPVVVVDDIIAVTPFENPIVQVGTNLTATQLNQVLNELDVDGKSGKWGSVGLVNFGVAGDRPTNTEGDSSCVTNTRYDLYTVQFHVREVYEQVQQAQPEASDPKPAIDFYSDGSRRRLNHHHHHRHRSMTEKNQFETTELWMKFVAKEWQCEEEDVSFRDNHLLVSLINLNTTTISRESSILLPFGLAAMAVFYLAASFSLQASRRRRALLQWQTTLRGGGDGETMWLLQKGNTTLAQSEGTKNNHNDLGAGRE